MSRGAAQNAFEALADPTRRRILHLLSENQKTSAGSVADAIPEIGRTAVSSHLRVLRNAELVIERREGRFRYYSLHPDGPVLDALGFLQSILSQGVAPDQVDDGVEPVDIPRVPRQPAARAATETAARSRRGRRAS